MRKLFYTFILLIITISTTAQEFNCAVQVSTPQIQGSDKRVFETLQKAIYEFVNNKKWTNYTFKIEERIECSILITIKERISADEFKGTLNIQLRRPIYSTSYNSVMLNYLDKDFHFNYIEYEPLDFIENTYTSNLTSVLAYYVYVFLGLDFDSYSLYGGTPFYEKAEAIVNSAQNTDKSGWKAYESMKNRYWLIENLLNSSYRPIREALYKYHRLGLDVMSDNVETGRAEIYASIELLKKANREKPDLFLMTVILTAKADEIVKIFSKASPMDKQKIVNILNEIDPANSSKYNKILENQ